MIPTSRARGVHTLRLQAAALERAAAALGDSFDRAVALVSPLTTSTLVVTGIGKAGHVGAKVSATFASLDVASFFVHPAEALHGDAGRFRKGDVALVFTHSGSSAELVRLLPLVSSAGCQVVAVTSSPDSPVARRAEVAVCYGALEEAGPLGLAPTTSTAVMLGIGDALAAAVSEARGLTRERYGALHPEGAIGRGFLTVRDVMRVGARHCVVRRDRPVSQVIHDYSATDGRPGAATVVDDDGRLAGIFTDGDLRRLLDGGAPFLHVPVGDVMSRNPAATGPDVTAGAALEVMRGRQIDQLIVIDSERRPVGSVDVQDVIRVLLDDE